MNKTCKLLLTLTLVAYIIIIGILACNIEGNIVSSYADQLITWVAVWGLVFGFIAASIGLAYTSKETGIRIGIDIDDESNKKHISL